MSIKLFDSELKIMQVLWEQGDLTAGQLAKILQEQTGWNRNTTYTVIKKCIQKGAVERTDPGFHCHALITRKEVQHQETEELMDKMFDNSPEKFFAAFLNSRKLSSKEVDSLKNMIEELK